MRIQLLFNKKGITLIELMVALVITAVVMAAIYRVFVSQTKTYAIQDQVVEVQQSVRGAMEILLRDLRMTGFDDDNPASAITIPTAIATPYYNDRITVNYEYYNRTADQYQKYTVTYRRDAATSRLFRLLAINDVPGTEEPLLQNVDALTFAYGIDANSDGVMDDRNVNGYIDDGDYVDAATVGSSKIVAVRVVLTARPERTDQDIAKVVSPRTLISAVTPRNLCLR